MELIYSNLPINVFSAVIETGTIFHSNGTRMIRKERFIYSALTFTAVSVSSGRSKIPRKKKKKDEPSSKFIATGKGSFYRNLNSMMSVRTTPFIKSLKIELTHALGNLPPPLFA